MMDLLPDALYPPEGPTRFRLGFVPAGVEAAAEARAIEARVFSGAFGNSEAWLDEMYGPYEPASFFITFHDGEDMVGSSRIIAPSPLGSQALAEITSLWPVSDADVAALGLVKDNVWDFATLSVIPEFRSGVASGAMTAAEHFLGSLLSPWHVALLDTKVFRYVQRRFGGPFRTFDAPPQPYAGSESTVPVYKYFPECNSRLASTAPMLLNRMLNWNGDEIARPSVSDVGRFMVKVQAHARQVAAARP